MINASSKTIAYNKIRSSRKYRRHFTIGNEQMTFLTKPVKVFFFAISDLEAFDQGAFVLPSYFKRYIYTRLHNHLYQFEEKIVPMYYIN